LRIDTAPKVGIGFELRDGLIEKSSTSEEAVGDDLNIATGRDLLQAVQFSQLLRESGEVASDVWKPGALIVSRYVAQESDTPGLNVGVVKTQALEGNRHPYHVAICGNPAIGVPERIEAHIVVLALGGNSIKLNSQRIGCKQIGSQPIVKCIQHYPDGIIIAEVLALVHVSANFSGFVFADEDHIQML